MLKIAISQCLKGDNVRYDGRSKAHHYVTGSLARHFELIPICPEVEIGMSIPRPPIHLFKQNNRIEVLQIDNQLLAYTDELRQHAELVSAELNGVCAYVFKARSPSCGVNNTPVINIENGQVDEARVSGVFANRIMELFPNLPIVDESILDNSHLCDQFLENIFCYAAYSQNYDLFIQHWALRWAFKQGESLSKFVELSDPDIVTAFFPQMNRLLSEELSITRLKLSLEKNALYFEIDQRRLNTMFDDFLSGNLKYVHIMIYLQTCLKTNTIRVPRILSKRHLSNEMLNNEKSKELSFNLTLSDAEVVTRSC